MEQKRLDEIRERCDRATKGSWSGAFPRNGHRFQVLDELGLAVCHARSIANTDFIAHARTDVPDLLDEVARLTADLAAMTAERDAMRERAEAAIEDLRQDCTTCKHKGRSGLSAPCLNCQGCGYSNWEWRGPVAENRRAADADDRLGNGG